MKKADVKQIHSESQRILRGKVQDFSYVILPKLLVKVDNIITGWSQPARHAQH